jgi:hypothetical protein
LVELMIAMALAGIVSAFLLMLTRAQLVAYEMNDQVTRAQQNGRAGLGFVETLLRRACSGIAWGAFARDVPSVATPDVVSCVRVTDGAKDDGKGSFAVDQPLAKPDAIEIVYGATPFTKIVGVSNMTSTNPSVTVTDKTGFNPNDYVLVTDYKQADLFQVDTVVAGTPPTINFKTLSGNAVSPDFSASAPVGPFVPAAGQVLMHAISASIYVDSTQNPPMLMYDPDGVLGTDHTDATPLVEGVEDFQIAVGRDGAPYDGVLTEPEVPPDDWIGNVSGDVLPALPWNYAANTDPSLRGIRASLMVRTLNEYSGTPPPLPQLEDRKTYPAVGTSTFRYRYRTLHIEVEPRMWNLGN